MTDALTAGIELTQKGWEVTLAPSGRKHPPVPNTTGAGERRPLTTADIATWASEGYGTLGIVMPPGIIGLDVDHYTKDSGTQKRGGDAIADLEQCAGALPDTWRTTSRNGDPISGIRLYQLPGGLEGRRAEGFGSGLPDVEFIRCEHRYAIVAPSVHPDTGDQYRWHAPDGGDDAPAVSDLPYLTHRHVDHLLRRCGCTFPTSVSQSSGSMAPIDRAFATSVYTDTEQAVNHFLAVMRGDEPSESRYDTMVSVVGHLVAVGALDKDIHAQLRTAYIDAVHEDRGGRGVAEDEYNRAGRTFAERIEPDPVQQHQPKPGTMSMRIATEAEVENAPPPEWHVENLIPKGGLTVTYGPPGVYKSFLSISLAMSLASGVDFLGHPITTPCRPLYVVGEGFYGIGPRIRAWKSHWGVEGTESLWHNGAVNLSSYEQVAELMEQIHELGVGFVFFDTLARCTLGVEENSASEMGLVIANLDRIRSETGAGVDLIHHSGKDVARGSRGSSAIKGAADAELSVTKGRLAVEKMKDGPEEPPTWFEMAPVDDFGPGGGSVVPVPTSARRIVGDDETGPTYVDDIEAVITFLEAEGAPRSMNGILRGVPGTDSRISKSIHLAVDRGHLTKRPGRGREMQIGLPEWD